MDGVALVVATAYLVLLVGLFAAILYRVRIRHLRNDSGFGTFPKD